MAGIVGGRVGVGATAKVAFLDRLREKIHTWTASLWDPKAGGFRRNNRIGANLMSSTDMAWMRYAVNDPDLFGEHRDAWIRYLQNSQNAEAGRLSYGPGPAGQGHPDGHAM